MSALWLLKKVRASDMQLAPTCLVLTKKMQTIIINVNNLASKSQLEAQRSGFELERRSKGAERSFKAAPKGAALKLCSAPTCVSLTKKMQSKISKMGCRYCR